MTGPGTVQALRIETRTRVGFQPSNGAPPLQSEYQIVALSMASSRPRRCGASSCGLISPARTVSFHGFRPTVT